MTVPDPLQSIVAKVSPAVEAPPVVAVKPAKLELLDGDEIIQLSIKPSLWYIALIALPWIVTIGVLAVAVGVALQQGWNPSTFVAFQILVAVGALRVGWATLQWASRLYVLTNRRIIRFKGVLAVEVTECPLAKISAADLLVAAHQRALHLGSIHFTPAITGVPPILWEQVAHATQVHELVVRAIRKSQSRD